MIFNLNAIGYKYNAINEADDDPADYTQDTDDVDAGGADYTPDEGDLDDDAVPDPEPDDGADNSSKSDPSPQEVDINVDVNHNGGDTGADDNGADSKSSENDEADPAEGGNDSADSGMDTGDAGSDENGDEADAGNDGGEEGDENFDDVGGGAEDRETLVSDLNAVEDELFGDLTDEQKAFKHKELKGNFVKLYQSTDKALKRLNLVPKTDSNVQVLKLAARKLIELKDMIHVNITETYYTRTFFENDILYKQCLAQFDAVARLLEEIIPDDVDVDEEDDDLDDKIADAIESRDSETVEKTGEMI